MEILRHIVIVYPSFEMTEETPRVWFEYMKDEDKESVLNEIRNHVLSGAKFAPGIAEVLPSKKRKLSAQQRYEDMEIARNKWINDGNDPDAFEYVANT